MKKIKKIPAKIKISTLKIIFKDMGIKYSILENKILVKSIGQEWAKACKIAYTFDFITRVGCNSKGEFWILIGEGGKTIKDTAKLFKISDKIK